MTDLSGIVKKAKCRGADNIEIILKEEQRISVSTRLVKKEKVIHSDSVKAKIRVSVGEKNAIASVNCIDSLFNDDFIDQVVSAAENSCDDNSIYRPEINQLCTNFKKIDMCDNSDITIEKLLKDSLKCEDAALSVKGITNSEGASAEHIKSKYTIIRNSDFCGSYEKSYNQLSVITLAEKDGMLVNDYDYSEAVYYSDLDTPEKIATRAAEKTLRKIGGRKISSCKVPVVFSKNVSRQLLLSFLSAINGSSIAKGVSFLKGKLSQKIFSDQLSISDLYCVDRGLRSRPFDDDCLGCKDNILVQNGVLNSFLLNTKYSKQLGMETTRNASGFDGITPNNIIIHNGAKSFDELIREIKNGLYVTDVLGNGLNAVTGNFSQGAVGYWIENGEIAYPVHEITIAGNFLDMLSHCQVASDLEYKHGIDSPTLFVENMVIGGV